MNTEEFRKNGHMLIDWIADYYDNIEEYPVCSQIEPGSILSQIPDSIPDMGENYKDIFNDFLQIIIPGITHWQHPNFYAYFPANTSFPSILGEMITAALGAQCMKWQTSPAATELEEKVMDWIKKLIGLPSFFKGVIQDSASSSTLCAILSARESKSSFQINKKGLYSNRKFRVYCSEETHSSIEKGVKISGIGQDNLIKIPCDDEYRMHPKLLEKAIKNDLEEGHIPLCIIATLGTTGTTAIDPLDKIGEISKKYNTWLHVDAAYAGSALILPEFQHLINGIESADSFVFNPHKWLFTNFDCSAYFVKNEGDLIKTFELIPEYLKTEHSKHVNDYNNWGIQLGRRFRALKLWFVLRSYGKYGLRNKIREHIEIGKKLHKEISSRKDFEIMAPLTLNLICFRYVSNKTHPLEKINEVNALLLETLNQSGKMFLTHTKLNGRYVIRFVASQTNVTEKHVMKAWKTIVETAHRLL